MSVFFAFSVFSMCVESPVESSAGFDSPKEALASYLGHFVEAINDKGSRIERLQAMLDIDILPQDLCDLYIKGKPGTELTRAEILKFIEAGAEFEEAYSAKEWEALPCRDLVDVAAGASIPGAGVARKPVTYVACGYRIEFEIGTEHETELEPITLIKIEGKWWVI